MICPACQSPWSPAWTRCPTCGRPATDAAAAVAAGVAAMAEHRYLDALASFERACRLEPVQRQAARGRAHALFHAGRLSEAEHAYDAVDPAFETEVTFNRGQIHVFQFYNACNCSCADSHSL